jgi:phospholipase D1/2
MKENNYTLNGNLNENIIQTESLDNQIKSNNDDLALQNIPSKRKFTTVRKPPNEILSELTITSVKSYTSTTNEIIGIRDNNSNEDMIIIEITGKTQLSEISWKIYKTHKQIRDLFNQTRKELTKKNLINDEILSICRTVNDYTNGEIYKNIDKISNNILYLYNKTSAKQCGAFREGLSISATSFIYENNGIKPFEGYAYKKAEPRCMRCAFKIICFPLEKCLFKNWNRRWVVLKDDMICYLNDPNTSVGKNVYWFDENITIRPSDATSLEINNNSKSLILNFNSTFERDIWEKEINLRIEKITEDITNNEYQSFTSQKFNCGAKWFVDGHDYFNYLYNQLLNATESVFITDWFLSPELVLKRPFNYNNCIVDEKNIKDYQKKLNKSNANRLMDIFYVLAKSGVKIYILLFCEPSLALAINSLHTKRSLQYLHPNIKVTRHPKGTQTILWSHHEKLVIIDQKIAFVGGLDLCWGRYDIHKHPISEEPNPYNTYYYPGSDYINERQVDLHNVERFYMEQLPRNKMPRMPWHDVHTMVEGPIVSDIVRHFVERWNDARFNRRNNGLVTVGSSQFSSFSSQASEKKGILGKILKTPITIELQSKEKEDIEDEKEIKLDNDDNSINDFKADTLVPGTISGYQNNNVLMSDDEFPINEKSQDSDDVILESNNKKNISNPKKPRRLTLFDSMKNKVKNKLHDYKLRHGKNKKMTIYQKAFLTDENVQMDQSIEMDCKIQALRSVCKWSIGKKTTERSILQGYYKLIDNSKHYIYIENQFFITKSFSDEERNNSNLNLSKIVKNEIGLHIRSRIERDYEEKTNFKVFICIPLLPGFSGTPGESSTMNGVLKHISQSISNNKGFSLLELLYKKMGEEVENYIYFFSLRNHGKIAGVPATEQIYIHSKLLIIDDQKVLLGSANINDRSMKGNRDSEFAIIIEQEQNMKSIMDGKPYSASDYALSLRKHLMAEHLGISANDEILNDPLNYHLWNMIKNRASTNASIYREIFDCFPDNKFTTFSELRNRRIVKNKEDEDKLKEIYEKRIKDVVGHIVEYPTRFLKDEILNVDFFSKENLVPEKNFS